MKVASGQSTAVLLYPVVVAVILLLCALPSALAQQACSPDQFSNDTCPFQFDGVCDAGVSCALGTDCVDCDPCHAYRFDGCDNCTTAGCFWCGADALCVSVGSPLPSQITCKVTDFVSTCAISTQNVFSDPFYDAASWIFDLIKIKEVWQSGISKSRMLVLEQSC